MEKVLNILFGHLWVVELTTPAANLPLVLMSQAVPVANLPPGFVDTGEKFFTSVVNIGGKFAAGVNDAGGAP
jgi:hypothetical protein